MIGEPDGDKELKKEDDYVSYHIFLFPFKWEIGKGKKGYVSFDERINIEQFEDKLLSNNKWEHKKFGFQDFEDYNEYNYFHDFVSEAIYDLNENLASLKTSNEDFFRHYQYNFGNESEKNYYNITLEYWDSKNERYNSISYKLEIDFVLLNIYSTGTGVLSFHLRNNLLSQSKPKDILRINQFGRRIYPPFLASKIGLSGTKSEMPTKIWISFGNVEDDKFSENFDFYNVEESSINSIEKQPIKLPKFITGFLPKDIFVTKENIKKEEVSILPIIDDRMFIICWYGNNYISKILTKPTKDNLKYVYCSEKNLQKLRYSFQYEKDFWYKFVFVDVDYATAQNYFLREKLIERHTYDRWTDFNTLYGITKYSLVCLTGDWNTLKGNRATYLPHHMKSMYYKMVELCLLQRATVLKFSDEVTHIVTEPPTVVAKNISDLYKKYIHFINKIYFRDITAQGQGSEMYEQMHSVMNIERDVKDLDGEIAELHNYASLISDKRNNNALTALTLIGAALFLPTFIAGYYGMNVFSSDIIEYPTTKELIGTIIGFISLSILSVGIFLTYKIQKPLRYFVSIIILLITLIIAGSMMSYPIYKGKNTNPPPQQVAIEKDSLNVNALKDIQSTLNTMNQKMDSLEKTVKQLHSIRTKRFNSK